MDDDYDDEDSEVITPDLITSSVGFGRKLVVEEDVLWPT